jgi:hypothetical protein
MGEGDERAQALGGTQGLRGQFIGFSLFTKTPSNQPPTPARPSDLEVGQPKQRINLLPEFGYRLPLSLLAVAWSGAHVPWPGQTRVGQRPLLSTRARFVKYHGLQCRYLRCALYIAYITQAARAWQVVRNTTPRVRPGDEQRYMSIENWRLVAGGKWQLASGACFGFGVRFGVGVVL